MKLNRKWILVASLVLSVALATSGTLAYLTDRDSMANVFTMGDVQIDLEEKFSQGAELIPGKEIEKKATITNTGNNDAWVWATIAVPAGLDQTIGDCEALSMGYDFEDFDAWDINFAMLNKQKLTKDEVEYNVYPLLHLEPLTKGQTTANLLNTVSLCEHVDIDPEGNMYHVVDGEAKELGWNINDNGNPTIYVSAYAIQKEGFENVQKAYEAYNTQWGDNGTEWGENDIVSVANYEELVDAIKNGGNIVLANDITVDEWVMFSERLSVGNGKITHVDKIDVSINGNNHTLTVNSIESASNGNRLFYDATKLNISDLTIQYANGVTGGIGLTSGVISNVNFVGGNYAILPGSGEIKVENCTFATNADAIYSEQERDNLTVTGCTFNQPADKNVILLRGDVKFTNNTVNSGRTVNIVSGSPVVTGNNFNNVRLKVYPAATATISGNTINNLAFETTTCASTFANNTLSTEAQAALDAVTPN